MHGISIFYDLETSDKQPIGQILNYAFIAVGPDWTPIAELYGEVLIDSFQLPHAGAILANRINVIEHQQNKTALPEGEAMLRIASFIDSVLAQAENKVPLIGYNSNRFDLPYLRTSFIRNGVNPYFGGKLQSADLFVLSKKLAVNCQDFPRLENPVKENTLTLRLEALAQHFSVLKGEQTHNSLDDVRITIDLARVYAEKFSCDIRNFEGYEVDATSKIGQIVCAYSPEYTLQSEEAVRKIWHMLLAEDYRSALWVDLDSYAAGMGRSAIRYHRKKNGEFFAKYEHVSQEHHEIATRALKEFADVSLNNFFEKSTCDIEQDIYRLDFDDQDRLRKAIHEGNETLLLKHGSEDARVLWIRHKLRTADPKLLSEHKKFTKSFSAYVQHRYGGAMQLSKAPARDGTIEYHLTYAEMLQDIEQAYESGNAADKELLAALKEFYNSSPVSKYVHAVLGAA